MMKLTGGNSKELKDVFGKLFLQKNSIRDVRLDSKHTSDIQTFESKTQQKFVLCQ